MSIKIDIANQVRQTTLPAWRPLIPVFEAIMNSVQAIMDANLPDNIPGQILVEIERDRGLFQNENPPVVAFRIIDNGIGLDDENFDSFNTAFSPHKLRAGGKGLGRFTWLKAFERANIESTFRSESGLLTRSFVFDDHYDLDDRGLPQKATTDAPGTKIELVGFRPEFAQQVSRAAEAFVQKLIEHFILILLEPRCPKLIIRDLGIAYDVNAIFAKDYRASASGHEFELNEYPFTLYGFRLPMSRTTKHKLVYSADQRAVTSDNLEEHMPNLGSRLEDENGKPFFYLAIVQSPYLSEHVNPNRTDFDFSTADDADLELDFAKRALIPRADIRNEALKFIENDLATVIGSINAAKLERLRQYVHTDAPQYRVLLKYAHEFIDTLPPRPTRSQMEAALHSELHQRETELRRQSTRIIKEADKIADYDEYFRRLNEFLDQYNELGESALVQYVTHRKIILEFLQRAIEIPPDSAKYPLAAPFGFQATYQ
jgi:hypothetical protein